MASGGAKAAEIISKIGKNVVQNVRTKEVVASYRQSRPILSTMHTFIHMT